ncbi:hypothetical protein FAGAP_3732 [Fusarium agapanthi]|uniref:Uncharacterized protein n=1 Tax=Fusarium agapanthi TaxID=1803897 RepID=A0A9P5BD83_9HYPO|nr:hypothetical protein FAGAP_3732 [Fusarium agapanthi]
MCQKSSYEKRCEDCNSRVIIHVVTHQVCNGKPPVHTTKAEKEKRKNKGYDVPYRKDRFICQRRIRPYKKYWSYVGSHACWHCSVRKQRKEAEEELKTLLADESRTEAELPGTLAKADERIWKSLEYLSQRSLEADEQPDDPTASADSPTTSDEEPSYHAAIDKGKGKAIATTEAEDLPSEATRPSPFLGPNQKGTIFTDYDAEMEEDNEMEEDSESEEDGESSEEEPTIPYAESTRTRDATIATLLQWIGRTNRP